MKNSGIIDEENPRWTAEDFNLAKKLNVTSEQIMSTEFPRLKRIEKEINSEHVVQEDAQQIRDTNTQATKETKKD